MGYKRLQEYPLDPDGRRGGRLGDRAFRISKHQVATVSLDRPGCLACIEVPLTLRAKTKAAILSALLLCLIAIIWVALTNRPPENALSYSQFLNRVREGQVASVIVFGNQSGPARAECRLKDGTRLRSVLPGDYRDALAVMQAQAVDIEIRDSASEPVRLLLNATPFLLLLAVWVVLLLTKFRPGRGLPG